MKCAYCHTELKEGFLYCTSCGKEVQIVPDYNEFDDEFLNGLVKGSMEEAKKKRERRKQQQEQKQQKQKQRMARMIGLLIGLFSAVIVLLLSLSYNLKIAHENSFDYQVMKGNIARDEQDTVLAAKYYQRALEIEPQNIDVRFTLAKLYMDNQDCEAALHLYHEIIQIDSDNYDAYKKLIEIYEEQEEIEKIIELSHLHSNDRIRQLFIAYEVEIPKFARAGGKYEEYFELELWSEKNDKIYYTLDGTDPCKYGREYQEPIPLHEEKTYEIKAVCRNAKGIYSSVVDKTYTIALKKPKMPEITPDGGIFWEQTAVSIQVPEGCEAYYTWNGADPDISSKKYVRPFWMPEGNNVLSVILYDPSTQKYSDVYRGRFVYYNAQQEELEDIFESGVSDEENSPKETVPEEESEQKSEQKEVSTPDIPEEDNNEKSDDSEKSDNSEKSDKTDKTDKTENTKKSGKSNESEKMDNAENSRTEEQAEND